MNIKAGIKSTEFWTATVGAIAAMATAASTAYAPVAVIGSVAAAVLPAAYICGRALLKAEQARQTNIVPDQWEPTLKRACDLAETLARSLGGDKAQ